MEPSALVYDTAAAAEVWRRVEPAIPAYGEGMCPAGACCPLPRRETDTETALGQLITDGAQLYADCRRCAAQSPRSTRNSLLCLAQEQQRAVRSLLEHRLGDVHPPPGVQETLPLSLRRVYIAEAVFQRGCGALSQQLEDGCLRQLLTAEAQRSAARVKRLAVLLESTLTTGNNLLKW